MSLFSVIKEERRKENVNKEKCLCIKSTERMNNSKNNWTKEKREKEKIVVGVFLYFGEVRVRPENKKRWSFTWERRRKQIYILFALFPLFFFDWLSCGADANVFLFSFLLSTHAHTYRFFHFNLRPMCASTFSLCSFEIRAAIIFIFWFDNAELLFGARPSYYENVLWFFQETALQSIKKGMKAKE